MTDFDRDGNRGTDQRKKREKDRRIVNEGNGERERERKEKRLIGNKAKEWKNREMKGNNNCDQKEEQ